MRVFLCLHRLRLRAGAPENPRPDRGKNRGRCPPWKRAMPGDWSPGDSKCHGVLESSSPAFGIGPNLDAQDSTQALREGLSPRLLAMVVVLTAQRIDARHPGDGFAASVWLVAADRSRQVEGGERPTARSHPDYRRASCGCGSHYAPCPERRMPRCRPRSRSRPVPVLSAPPQGHLQQPPRRAQALRSPREHAEDRATRHLATSRQCGADQCDGIIRSGRMASGIG